jgi:hypothetical protein
MKQIDPELGGRSLFSGIPVASHVEYELNSMIDLSRSQGIAVLHITRPRNRAVGERENGSRTGVHRRFIKNFHRITFSGAG